MPLGTDAANHAAGSLAAARALEIHKIADMGRGGKTTPFGHQESIGRDACNVAVMMEAAPSASFVVAQPEFLFEFLIIPSR